MFRTHVGFAAAALGGLALSGCIGVSAPRLNPDGTPAPMTYCPRGTYIPDNALIDDFEDGNTRTAQIAGRGGYWWKSADSAGAVIGPDDFKPVASGPGESLAIHAVGETVTGDSKQAWGAQFGANFTQGEFYDATKYAGVRFRAKVGAKSTPSVRFKVADVNTHPSGDVCKSCYNHFGKDLSLSTEWQQFEFFFGSMQQAPYWGDPRPASIDPSELFSFDFAIGPGNAFDVWVDDLEFFACR